VKIRDWINEALWPGAVTVFWVGGGLGNDAVTVKDYIQSYYSVTDKLDSICKEVSMA
jgi:hypothetical protein